MSKSSFKLNVFNFCYFDIFQGANWLASTSDVFNNWVFTCKNIENCLNGPRTILSTTHDSDLFPSRMANVTLFHRDDKDIWKSWDEDGGIQRWRRYNGTVCKL